MLSARATNGHRYIAAIVGLVARKPTREKLFDVSVHFIYGWLFFQKFNNIFIFSGQWAQVLFPILLCGMRAATLTPQRIRNRYYIYGAWVSRSSSISRGH